MNNSKDLTNVNTVSDFSDNIHRLFREIRPKKIIETGTYLGTGTTTIIASALRHLAIEDAVFYSIEVNPDNQRQAASNLKNKGLLPYVTLIHGLSIPRHLLPTIEEIDDSCVKNIANPHIYLDHHEHERALKYYNETNWKDVPDDRLGICLHYFNGCPDFVLLDSAGHMGNIEFNYLIQKLRSDCIIALDDTNHIKHYKSLLQIRNDPRFQVIVESKERTGFSITLFRPSPKETGEQIGEGVLCGERFFSQGRIKEAVECFHGVLMKDPSNVSALNNLGVIAFQLNDTAMAEDFFVRALRIDRRNPDALMNLAEVHNSRRETGNAARISKAETEIENASPQSREGHKNFQKSFSLKKKEIGHSFLSPPKKIILVTNLYPPQELGGYGRILKTYVQLLEHRGHTVHVLTSNTSYLGKPTKNEPKVDRSLHLFGEWGPGGMMEYERERAVPIVERNHKIIQNFLTTFKPDICLVGNIDLLSAMVFQPMFDLGLPVLHRLGNEFIGYPLSDSPKSPLYRVIVPSQWLKDDAMRRGYPFHHANVIYSGAAVKEFEMPFPPSTDSLRIAYAGLVNGYKGPQVLIDALDLIHEEGIDFTCTIAGGTFDEHFFHSLKTRVRNLGLAEKVRFTGWLDREGLKDLFAQCNVLVFPSLVNETFGISQAEAMTAGLLVITSGTGGAEEVIEDNVSGLRFRQGDSKQLVEVLIGLTRDRERWERIAAAGKERAVALFDIERSVDQLEITITEMLRNNSTQTWTSRGDFSETYRSQIWR